MYKSSRVCAALFNRFNNLKLSKRALNDAIKALRSDGLTVAAVSVFDLDSTPATLDPEQPTQLFPAPRQVNTLWLFDSIPLMRDSGLFPLVILTSENNLSWVQSRSSIPLILWINGYDILFSQ